MDARGDAIVTTTSGRVRGEAADGITVFRGIPFAAPPDGPRRFGHPAAPESWDGVRDAAAFGPAPPQPAVAPGAPELWRPADGLDCLTVNVWTPDHGGAGLPVMVWIYGGAWKIGGSGQPGFDGSRLAGSGVVVVTFNYRVGFEGFGLLPGVPANRGLLDQVAALEWVQRNIAGFGGDPGNVTVFGESAGAASVAVLLGAPGARDLFRRAIAQSIPGGFLSVDHAEKVTKTVAAAAGVPATRDGFATLSPEAVLKVQEEPLKRWRGAITAYGPVIDGELVTGQPWLPIQDGAGRDIDLICGFTHDEYRLFTFGTDLSWIDLDRVATRWGLDADAVAEYREAYPVGSDEELFDVMMSDALFRMPSTWVAEAHAFAGGRTWLYDFAWSSPLLGACHSLDVPFTFGTGDSPIAARLIGSPAPPDFAVLSQQIRTAWTSFAATGDPGWPRFDLQRRITRIWDVPHRDTEYPLAASRQIWERATR